MVFMVTALVATVGLGGAVVYELGRAHPALTLRQTGAVGSAETAADNGAAVPGDATAVTGAATVQAGATAARSGVAASGAPGAATNSGRTAANNIKTQGGTQAVTGKVVTVGGIYDETGPVDATVERDTVRAYFNKVNAAGGVNGHLLQLIDCDSKFNATDAANCTNKLLNDNHVFALVGSTSVNEDLAVKPANDAGVPIVGGLGTPEEFKYPLSYPVSANFVTYGTAMGNRASELKMTDVGLVVVNIPFIKTVEAELKRTLAAKGINVVNTQEVDATKANYADVVLAFQQAGAKSILAALDPFSYQRLFQSMQGASYKPPLLGLGLDKGSANPNPQQPNKGYTKFVEGMHSLTPMLEPFDHQNDPAVRDYLDTVKKYFPNQVDPLDVYTEHAWAAAELFVDTLRRAGANPTQQSFVAALNQTKNFDAGLPSVKLSYSAGPSHDPNRCFWMLENKNVTWTTVSEPRCF
jgi:branched-chain amino acid transport system substrate-binding protein